MVLLWNTNINKNKSNKTTMVLLWNSNINNNKSNKTTTTTTTTTLYASSARQVPVGRKRRARVDAGVGEHGRHTFCVKSSAQWRQQWIECSLLGDRSRKSSSMRFLCTRLSSLSLRSSATVSCSRVTVCSRKFHRGDVGRERTRTRTRGAVVRFSMLHGQWAFVVEKRN